MTGRRKRKGRALRVARSIENSRALFEQRLSRAQEPGHKTSAAAGYLLAILRRTPPQVAIPVDEALCRTVLAEAERLESANLADLQRRKEQLDERELKRQRHHVE